MVIMVAVVMVVVVMVVIVMIMVMPVDCHFCSHLGSLGLLGLRLLGCGLLLLGLGSQLEGPLDLCEVALLGQVLQGLVDEAGVLDHIVLVVGLDVLLDGRDGAA